MKNSTESTNCNSLRNPKSLSMFNSLNVLESPEMVSEIIPALVAFLKRFNRNQIVSKIAACVMNQSNHKHTMRLDILIRLAIYHCTGSTPARQEQLKKILNTYIQKKGIHQLDDYPMYPFAETFMGRNHDVLLMNGSLCPAVRNAQYTYDALVTLNSPQITPYIDQVDNFILLINLINEQVGFTVDYEKPVRMKEFVDIRFVKSPLISKTVLRKNGISVSNLKPFICDYTLKSSLLNQNVESNGLTITPLLETEEEIIIAAPHNLALSIKNFILSTVSTETVIEDFQSALAKIERAEMNRHHFNEMEHSKVEYVDNYRIEQSSRCIGSGRFVLAFYIVESIEDPRSDKSINFENSIANLITDLQSRINELVKRSSTESTNQHTQIFIITSSNRIRLRIFDEFEHPNNNYAVFSVHPEDIAICSRVFDLTVNDLWRYGKILTDFVSEGIHLRNNGTFVNLIGYLVQRSNRLSCDDKEIDGSPSFIDIGFEHEKKFKDKNVTDRNLRSRLLPNKERVQTETFNDDPNITLDKSLFKALKHERGLVGIESEYATIWLEFDKSSRSLSDFEYFIWTTLHGILTFLAKSQFFVNPQSVRTEPILVKLKLSNFVYSKIPYESEMCKRFRLSSDTESRVIEVLVNVDWHSDPSISRQNWSSEIAKELLTCFLKLDPLLEPKDKMIKSLVEEASSDDVVFGAIADPKTATDYMLSEGIYEPCRPIYQSAIYFTRVNRKKLIYSPNKISKKENSILLHDYSNHCMHELISKIRSLDKKELLDYCLRQYHNAVIEERRWNFASRPRSVILDRAAAESDYLKAYRNTAKIIRATPILVEISIHEASKIDRQNVERLEFEELMALALELFKVSNYIDVERYKPEDVQVFYGIDGALNFTSKLDYDAYPLITDQIIDFISVKRDRSKQEKKENEEEKSDDKSTIENDKRFVDAFVCEYGMSIGKVRSFLNGVLSIALNHKMTYIPIERSKLQSMMCVSGAFEENEVKSILERLTVKP